jgi:Spy/CpxP family protein refolding chaperone
MQAATLMAGVKVMFAAVALTVGLGTTGSAQPVPVEPGFGEGGPAKRGPGGRAKIAGPLGGLLGLHPELPLAALNLTDAQREQVRTILQGHRDEGQALMQRGHTAMEALRKATDGTVDEGAAGQQGQALGAVIAEAAVLRGRVRGEIMAILTPEQQAEAAKIQAERETKMKLFRKMESKRERPAKMPKI